MTYWEIHDCHFFPDVPKKNKKPVDMDKKTKTIKNSLNSSKDIISSIVWVVCEAKSEVYSILMRVKHCLCVFYYILKQN